MGPMSLGAMSYGSATGALIPDFAMALQRPDRPPFQQASPTSPYQNVFPGHNLVPQYAYSQPQMNDRTRSMSLDQSAPGFAQQPYHYPASMTYKHQAMPMQAGGYGVGKCSLCFCCLLFQSSHYTFITLTQTIHDTSAHANRRASSRT